MAKATKTPVTGYTVVLELDQQEAETLGIVLNRVGGPPSGKRGTISNILVALRESGVYVDPTGRNDGITGYYGSSLYFGS